MPLMPLAVAAIAGRPYTVPAGAFFSFGFSLPSLSVASIPCDLQIKDALQQTVSNFKFQVNEERVPRLVDD